MTTTRTEIVALARSVIDRRVRFRPYGRDPDHAFDCIGLVIWIAWEIGAWPRDREIPAYSFPPSTENFEHITEYLVRTEEIQPGTVIVFTTPDNTPAHVGIVSHQREDGVWKMIGSIPGTLRFGQFSLIPTISDNVWGMFDYPNIA